MKTRWLFFLLLSLTALSCQADKSGTPPEIGTVTYLRDFDQAAIESKKTGKPIFAFFQEVPG